MKKIEKKIAKFLTIHPHDLGLVNYAYVFLIVIAVLYGGLIFALGQKIAREKGYVSDNKPASPFEKQINHLTHGYPIERMAPYIATKDKRVATYLVAIAKKESNWGKFSPKKDGKECWNFWGYRGAYNQTASGYSCFDSPRQAVSVVGGRLQDLVDQNIETPRQLAVWKCGYDCSWDNPAAVNKWVSDVDYYYKKIYE